MTEQLSSHNEQHEPTSTEWDSVYDYEGVVGSEVGLDDVVESSSDTEQAIDMTTEAEYAAEQAYENPYIYEDAEKEAVHEVAPDPAQVLQVCEMARSELGYKNEQEGLTASERGDAAAMFRLSQLFEGMESKPPGYQEGEDPVEYLERQVKELGAMLPYQDPDKPIENVGYRGSDYYTYRRALQVYNELSRNPSMLETSLELNALDPELSAKMFGDMYR